MDMSLSKLQELVMDRVAWHAAVHRVTKSWTWLSNWTELNLSLGFPGSSVSNNPSVNARDSEDMGSVPGLGRSLGEENGNPLQYSCLENPRQRSLACYSPSSCKESDITEWLKNKNHSLLLWLFKSFHYPLFWFKDPSFCLCWFNIMTFTILEVKTGNIIVWFVTRYFLGWVWENPASHRYIKEHREHWHIPCSILGLP